MMNGISTSAPASIAAWSHQPLNERQPTEIELRARLRASEARFRDLLEMTSDWFWEQDAQFRFTCFSTDLAQGYFFGSPAPAEDFVTELIRQGSSNLRETVQLTEA
jgi:hypothetical protein